MLLHRMEELIRLAGRTGVAVYSDFLDLRQQRIVRRIDYGAHDAHMTLTGGYEAAERKVAVIRSGEAPAVIDTRRGEAYEVTSLPFVCIRIAYSVRFQKEVLTHRDYLGALTGLGISRSKIGDIAVSDDGAYVFAGRQIADFLCLSLNLVKHTPVTAQVMESFAAFPAPKFISRTGSIASVRLDALVALAFSTSRSSVLPLIATGKVYVNGEITESSSHVPKEGDIISVRGRGKFRFDGISHQTKKGRNMADVSLYQ